MSQDTNTIIHTLEKMRLKKSISLSVDKKASILNSVFESTTSVNPIIVRHYTSRIPSPFLAMFSRYVLPVFALLIVGKVFGDGIFERAQLAIEDYNTVKSDVQLQNSLIETKKDIAALKTLGFAESDSDSKKDLTDKVTNGSREIRNQVASLVKENKITEAKEIVLTLETALKTDELYKVATSVSDEVFETTDLRVELERKEAEASISASSSATTTTKNIQERLEGDKKELADLEDTASTTEMLAEANKFLLKSETYLKAGEIENAIISLQAHDRIVAELKLLLVR